MIEHILNSKKVERTIFLIVILVSILFNDSIEIRIILPFLVLICYKRCIFGETNTNSLEFMLKNSKIDFILTLVLIVEFFGFIVLM
ncbi:hypothetical protein [Methanobrevibacter woesei]|uniref:hypothetical protein n=1 Tax=Methanobrevibacter woesei TaxID=190976 RepID=UPI0039F6049A